MLFPAICLCTQLASLLRGVLAMPAQHNSSTDVLLSEAQVLLPQTLSSTSTAVLTELIKSLAQHMKTLQQQQGAPAASNSVLSSNSSDASSSSSSSDASSGRSTAGELAQQQQQQQQQEAVLGTMLQDCVGEWRQAVRVGQLTQWQAVSVERALEGCGQAGLAAAAKQVGRALLQPSLLSHSVPSS